MKISLCDRIGHSYYNLNGWLEREDGVIVRRYKCFRCGLTMDIKGK